MQYLHEKINGEIKVVENTNYEWAVLDGNGVEIVPWGKYQWIDGYDNGLARVFTVTNEGENRIKRWGMINEKGEEVLPVVYDKVWNFLGKGRYSTTVEKDGQKISINFCDLNPNAVKPPVRHQYHSNYREWQHYEEYAGSYAQEYEGWSDEMINDAFDGDPDAYWNID